MRPPIKKSIPTVAGTDSTVYKVVIGMAEDFEKAFIDFPTELNRLNRSAPDVVYGISGAHSRCAPIFNKSLRQLHEQRNLLIAQCIQLTAETHFDLTTEMRLLVERMTLEYGKY